MKKKLLTTVMALSLACCFVTACGNEMDSDTNNSATSGEVTDDAGTNNNRNDENEVENGQDGQGAAGDVIDGIGDGVEDAVDGVADGVDDTIDGVEKGVDDMER